MFNKKNDDNKLKIAIIGFCGICVHSFSEIIIAGLLILLDPNSALIAELAKNITI